MEELNLANALAGMQKSPCHKRSAKIDNLIENQALGQKKSRSKDQDLMRLE
jgi:hypothetical protein